MKIEINYPGQDVQVVDAAPGIVRHFLTRDWDLPFVKLLSTIRPATAWSRLMKDKDGVEFWDFNHIEDGHCENDVPTPQHPSHKNVWNGKWQKEFIKLVNDGQMGVDKVHRYL